MGEVVQMSRMKATGIIRRVDELGRIVIPRELCRAYGISKSTQLEILTEDDTVILRKYVVGCVFCGSTKEVEQHKGKPICRECMEGLRNL